MTNHDPEVIEAVARVICGGDAEWRDCSIDCLQAAECAGTLGKYQLSCAADILDALTALGWKRISPGERVAPVEPTEEMIDAAFMPFWEGDPAAVWRAMLHVAPQGDR